MRHARTLLAAAALLALPACDSGGGDGLEASYFVGNWTLVEVRDDTGDRTADVQTLVDELAIDFNSTGQFAMALDYSDIVNGSGTPDTTFAGAWAVSGSGALVMTPSASAGIAFGVQTQGASRAELSAPAVIINQLLSGSALDLGLVGTAVLTIAR